MSSSSSSSLRVYGAPLSQPTRAVLLTCKLLGVEVEFVPINAEKGEHKTADFLALNPNALFPVLQIRSEPAFVLYESHAIMRYLCEEFDGKGKLYPKDARQRALANQWLDWKHANIRVGAAGLVRRRVFKILMKDISNHSMKYDLEEIPESREVRILMNSLKVLNDQLTVSQAVGSSFLVPGTKHATIADIAIAMEVEQLLVLPSTDVPPFGSKFAESFPQVGKWMESVRQLNGFKEVCATLYGAVAQLEKARSAAAKKAKL